MVIKRERGSGSELKKKLLCEMVVGTEILRNIEHEQKLR